MFYLDHLYILYKMGAIIVMVCYVGWLGSTVGGIYNSISRMLDADGFWNIISEGMIGMILGSIWGCFIFNIAYFVLIFVCIAIEKGI